MDSLIFPVQDRLEEWKKTATQLEKDHSKGIYICAGTHALQVFS